MIMGHACDCKSPAQYYFSDPIVVFSNQMKYGIGKGVKTGTFILIGYNISHIYRYKFVILITDPY